MPALKAQAVKIVPTIAEEAPSHVGNGNDVVPAVENGKERDTANTLKKLNPSASPFTPTTPARVGPPPTILELDKNQVIAGLHQVARRLAYMNLVCIQHRKPVIFQFPVDVIAAGGVVSLMGTCTRETTPDIDFHIDPLELAEVLTREGVEAAKPLNYRRQWFHGGLTQWVLKDHAAKPGFPSMEYLAYSQQKILFECPELRVFAADWRYQMIHMLSQIQKKKENTPEKKELWLADAVGALHCYIKSNGGRPIFKTDLLNTFVYASTIHDANWRLLAEKYQETHGKPGLHVQ